MQAYILIKCKTGSEAKIISEFKELPEEMKSTESGESMTYS